MSELLERIRGEIRARLEVSAAAVRESERLEAALVALDGTAPPAQRSRPATSRRARRRAEHTARAKRAPRGANRAAALSVIAERPGVGAGDLAAATGVKRAVLYALLTRLVEEGEIVKHVPADGPATYAPATSELAARSDASPEIPEVDDASPPQGVGDASAEPASPDSDGVPPAATSEPVLEPQPSTPRARRRAKAKRAAALAPEPVSEPGESARSVGDETSAIADGLPSTDEGPAAPDPPVTAPRPKRRAAKPRAASRAPRRAKPKPKPAA